MRAERPNIGPRFTGHPEYAEPLLLIILNQLGLVDGPDPELPLDCGNFRRLLEQAAGERLQHLLEPILVFDGPMEPDDANILLSGTLLGLHQPGRPLQTHNQTARDLGVEGAGVASLVHFEDLLDPGDDLVGAGVRGLVEVDHAVFQVLFQGTLQWRGARRDRRVVAGQDVHRLVVLEQERPVGGVRQRTRRGWFDYVLLGQHLGVQLDLLLDGLGSGLVLLGLLILAHDVE